MTSQQPTNHAALCANCVIAAVESADENNDMLLHPPPFPPLPPHLLLTQKTVDSHRSDGILR